MQRVGEGDKRFPSEYEDWCDNCKTYVHCPQRDDEKKICPLCHCEV